MTDLPTPLVLPIDMAGRRFVVCEHSGDTFSENEDYSGLALTLELKSEDEANGVLDALLRDPDGTHEHLADTEARHAHRELLAEKDAEIMRLKGLLAWAHDTLIEINPSNYDHDDVCRMNAASVEVILGIAPEIKEPRNDQ